MYESEHITALPSKGKMSKRGKFFPPSVTAKAVLPPPSGGGYLYPKVPTSSIFTITYYLKIPLNNNPKAKCFLQYLIFLLQVRKWQWVYSLANLKGKSGAVKTLYKPVL